MKLTIEPIAIVLSIGALILSTLGLPAFAEGLVSGPQTPEITHLDGNYQPQTTSLSTQSDRSPLTLEDPISTLSNMANSAKMIYSLVKVGNWPEAAHRLRELQRTTQSLQANPAFNLKEIAHIDAWLVPLGNLIVAKQPLAMDAANHLAMVAPQMTIQSNSGLPVEVAMLGYYGRELEIQIGGGYRSTRRKWMLPI